MAASNCSSTFRRFWLGRRAPTRSTPDGHPPGAANPPIDLRGHVDAPIDDEVQINSATSTTSSGSPAWIGGGADLASTDADGVVQPAIGVAVGLMKTRPDDLPASGGYARPYPCHSNMITAPSSTSMTARKSGRKGP